MRHVIEHAPAKPGEYPSDIPQFSIDPACCSWKTVRFSEQAVSADRYPSKTQGTCTVYLSFPPQPRPASISTEIQLSIAVRYD